MVGFRPTRIKLFLVLLMLGAGVSILQRISTPQVTAPRAESQDTPMLADVDGNGVADRITFETKSSGGLTSIKATSEDTQIATTPQEFSAPAPMDGSFRVFSVSEEDKRDYFSFDFIAGPHEINRMFFVQTDGSILPVCFVAQPQGPQDCLFYSTRPDGIFVKDLNNDGKVEVVEFVDEYPKDGEVTEEERKAITQAFEAQGINDLAEGALRIAIREKGGRGRSVVWQIYSFNGTYFMAVDEKTFNELFEVMKKDAPEIMKKSELSKESLDYNNFTRSFWNKRSN